MILFFDTSALIKRYVEEDGSEETEALLEGAERVLVAPTILLECASVLRRLQEAGALAASRVRETLGEIERDTAYFERASFDADLEGEAVRLELAHNLRTLDAIQLASAVLRRRELDKFVCCDGRLLEAARREKLRVENPGG